MSRRMNKMYYMCEICFGEFTSKAKIGGHLQSHGKISSSQWSGHYLELPYDIAYSKWFRDKRKQLVKEQATTTLSSRPKKRKIKKKSTPTNFFNSRAWKELRYKVLAKYGSTCMSCGRNPKIHNISIQVDHIKPRIKYPNLELDEDNLQVLCADCNQGKSYTDETDWR